MDKKVKGKAKMGKNKVCMSAVSTFHQVLMFSQRKCAKQSSSDSSSDDGEKNPKKKKKMGQAQWIAQITADNQCPEHKQICLKSIASHPPLKNVDIATWALIMVSNVYLYLFFLTCTTDHWMAINDKSSTKIEA